MVKHNNIIPQSKFKKDWDVRVRTWFNQAGKKKARRAARAAKAAAIAPRPVSGALRPVVAGQTAKYNVKVKAGRGFSLAELKAAGINSKVAPTIGIAVDARRFNKSQESLDANVARLNEYMSRLVVFPKHPTKGLKKGDTAIEAAAAVPQLTGAIIPIKNAAAPATFVTLTADQKSFAAAE
eukprot:CAMPEP_0197581758 /NCGR_PEP_ID=MMETSP1326-20131121/5169_1 /TAXON_ID=1155430 /ORGANISM="Genus nov. species nov., Strain RCC2288" /LENGTH=180 /DNA_ID=CAMNT_0043145709 /DNA_START=74 /DNA_END=613 /DNA_ORIENTATION=-